MQRRAFLKAGATLITCAVLPVRSTHATPGANILGQWQTLPYVAPINPIHMGLLRPEASGHMKVLVVAGSENSTRTQRHVAGVLDVTAGTFAVQTIPWDLFCSGMAFLADGRVLITGGTSSYTPFSGEAYTISYDPVTGAFTELRDMYRPRWYPTNTVLSDGRILTLGGRNQEGKDTRTMEIYDPTDGTWSLDDDLSFTPPLYPRAHLLPNGRVFYTGTGTPREYNPSNDSWRSFTIAASKTYGSSVLLTLKPPYLAADTRILIAGGGSSPARASVRLVRPVDPVGSTVVSPLRFPRADHNGTLLPTGHVLVTGGRSSRTDSGVGVKQAEWFDPSTNRWTTLATAAYVRAYHSNALLLPDATILTAGSNPSRGQYERRMERFFPPYLSTTNASGQVVAAPRPHISNMSQSRVRYAASFTVFTPDADSIASVVLMRPGAVTHAFDMEQRGIKVSFTRPSSNRLSVVAPPNSAVAPAGYHMVFLINVKGVPSVAAWIRVTQ